MRRSQRICFASCLLLLAGCGDSDPHPELFPASGAIVVNGSAAVGARVILHPADGRDFDARGSRPTGVVENNGHFEISTYAAGDGAPAGEYRASIMWMAEPDSSAPWDKLRGRYIDPASSGVTVSITPGTNLLPPIELDRVRLQEKRPGAAPRDIDGIE